MDTDILTPKALFQKDIRYIVPEFQRRYVWTQDEQWEPLWEDVRNTADDYLEQLDNASGDRVVAEQNTARHFLGAVVVQQVNTATRDVDRREIIDGQQRLTTLQLLLDAVQYVCEEHGHGVKGVATRLSKLVTNDEDLVEEKNDIFKLWPTTNDQDAFKHAMQNGLATDAYENSLIVQAHEYFQLQASQWLGSDTELIPARAEALETTVTGDLPPLTRPRVTLDTEPFAVFSVSNTSTFRSSSLSFPLTLSTLELLRESPFWWTGLGCRHQPPGGLERLLTGAQGTVSSGAGKREAGR